MGSWLKLYFMVTRIFLNNFNSGVEQKLYEDLVGEIVQTWGIDTFYLPRSSESANGFDLLFGDDPTKKYDKSYQIEAYVQSVDNFEGGELFSKFGLQVKKQARFLMPKRAFDRELGGVYTRPREGDLLWLSNFRALFEIKYVDEEYFFYDFGNEDFYAFSLICEKFRYNDEKLNTGTAADQVADTLGFVWNFYLANTANTGTYSLGETVYQTANAHPTGTVTSTANVVSWNLPSGTLQLKNVQGEFVINANVFGTTSAADWKLSSVNMSNSVNHMLSDNQGVKSEANGILDFSESNPFGEPTR